MTQKTGRVTASQLMLGAFLVLCAFMLMTHGAHAQSSSASAVWTNAQAKATDVFYQFRTVVLIICGIAIIGTMVTAVSGRFPIAKAITTIVAIVVIAFASSIVTYFASATSTPAASFAVPQQTDTGSYQ